MSREQIEDWGSTSVGALIFGFLTTSGMDKEDIMGVVDALSRAQMSEIIVGGVLFFLLWRHKKR